MSFHRCLMRTSSVVISLLFVIGLAGCSKKPRQPATQAPAPVVTPESEPETEVAYTDPEPIMPIEEDTLARVDESADILSRSLEDINAQSPLTDIPFEYDRPNESGLTAEVKAGERNMINLPLKSDLSSK